MKNDYEVVGKIVLIRMKHGFTAVVDRKDLPRLLRFRWKWHAWKNERHKTWYAVASTHDKTGRKRIVLMHRLVLGLTARDRVVVDHGDHNGLNNRRGNLEATSSRLNNLRRSGLNRNNTSGVRGVVWSKSAKKWKAQLMLRRRHVHLGYFKDLTEAGAVVREALRGEIKI